MKITLLLTIEWATLFCLICGSDGARTKKECTEKQRNKNGVCRESSILPATDMIKSDSNLSGNLAKKDVNLSSIACGSSFSGQFDATNYFVSSVIAPYHLARDYCYSVLGKDGGLVSIETEEENNYLNQFLEKLGGGEESFWTGGFLDANKKYYRWASTLAKINPDGTGWSYNPWGPGQQTYRGDFTLALHHQNRFYSEWSTQSRSTLLRFICERQNNNSERIVPCYTDVDLDIVLDTTGNFGADMFKSVLRFLSRLITAFVHYGKSRIGVLGFDLTRILTIDNKLTSQEIQNKILSIQNKNYDKTMPPNAIDASALELSTKKRKGIRQNMLVVTSVLLKDPTKTIEAVEKLQKLGINTYCVGVGHSVYLSEALIITNGITNRFIQVLRIEQLYEFLTALSKDMCEAVWQAL